MLVWILIIIGSVALDQLSKQLVVAHMAEGSSIPLIPEVLNLTYIRNEGAAFGMLSDHRWVFMIVSTVAIIALIVYLWKFRPESKLACTALSLIIGGGIGNMIDRVYLNYVIDFIDFCAFDFWIWIFNIADACVCVGGGILFVWCITSLVKESVKDKRAKIAVSSDGENTEENNENK